LNLGWEGNGGHGQFPRLTFLYSKVTTLGTGVDGAVQRIDAAYDMQGNAYLLSS
jgi:hypothetical protein